MTLSDQLTAGKKPQLQLHDEDILSTAEITKQSRHDQWVAFFGIVKGWDLSWQFRVLGCYSESCDPTWISYPKWEDHHSVENLKKCWNLNGIGVSSVGNLGELALLWNKQIQVDLRRFSSNYIDSTVKFTDIPVRITGIYGIPETNQRHLMWNLLRNLHRGDQLP